MDLRVVLWLHSTAFPIAIRPLRRTYMLKIRCQRGRRRCAFWRRRCSAGPLFWFHFGWHSDGSRLSPLCSPREDVAPPFGGSGGFAEVGLGKSIEASAPA